MQLSSLIGKNIVSPAGEQLGYITGAYLSRDLFKLVALAAVDGEEEEFLLPMRAVQAIGDAVIAGKSRASAISGVPAPIGVHAYSEKGALLGVVADWLFGDCDPAVIIVRDGVRKGYPAEKALSEESVIVYLEEERPAPAKKKPKSEKKRPEELPPVSLGQDEALSSPISETQSPSDEAASAPLPEAEHLPPEHLPSEQNSETGAALQGADADGKKPVKFELGGRNLLGRKVVRSVFDAQGEPVALAGDRITPEVLSRARRKGRLLALTVNTLTNVY